MTGKPKPVAPSAAQLKALQVLRFGKLVWNRPGLEGLNSIHIEIEKGSGARPDNVHRWIHPTTARKIVDAKLVSLKSFDARHGEYRLTKNGRDATELFCQHPHILSETVTLLSGEQPSSRSRKHDWESERLLCLKCWRRVGCVSRKSERHGASRWHYKWGAICQAHWERPFGKVRATELKRSDAS